MATLTPDRLTDAYMAQVQAIRTRVLAYTLMLWDSAANLRDADIDRIVARIIPAVRGGQMQVAHITNAYVARIAALEGVTRQTVPVAEDVIDYRGVPPQDVYRRPAITVYTALAGGTSFAAARAQGRTRLASIVGSDIQQTRNRQARAAYTATGFDYTVRVLSGAENCALCVIASTQRYNTADLQPIHPGCDCGERGVRAGRDPGQVIDPTLLEQAYEQIDAKLTSGDPTPALGEKRTARGKKLSDLTDLIITREHGEYGPVLTWRQDRFTGPDGLD